MRAKRKITEKELAAQIQRQRGDVSTWSKRSVPADERRETAVVFSVRFSPSELDGIRKQADALGITVARIIRHAVLEHSAQQSMVLDFSGYGAGVPPTMLLLGGTLPTKELGCEFHNMGFPGYYQPSFVIPPSGTANIFVKKDDPAEVRVV